MRALTPQSSGFGLALLLPGAAFSGVNEDIASVDVDVNPWSTPMQKLNDLSRSLTPLKPDRTLIAVIEMSLSSWLVAGIVPGVERQPSKKLEVDESALLKLLHRWREEAAKAGRRIKRSFLGWLRGERDHCKMVAIPTIKDEDAKRPNRERESLIGEQSRIVNRMKAALV